MLTYTSIHMTIQNILTDFENDVIQVPEIIDTSYWPSLEQDIELLTSIKDGIPIGQFILWRTSQELKMWVTEKEKPVSNWTYIIDGWKRLNVLLSLSHKEVSSLYYDLVDECFYSMSLKPYERAILSLPVNTLLDPRLIYSKINDLANRHNLEEEDTKLYTERAERLSYCFQSYRIPVLSLITEDIELVKRTVKYMAHKDIELV